MRENGEGFPSKRFAAARGLLGERNIIGQFLRFGCVGLCGFAADTAVVYALRGWIGLYAGGVAAYFVAATVTWALNRAWTFRGRGHGAAHRQWGLFLMANLAGFVLNRGTYAALIATQPIAARYPVIAIFVGAVAGMGVNFALARSVVFRAAAIAPGDIGV